MMVQNEKAELFERMPVPKAVMSLSVPTVISSLVMVIYNLADTYFVGMLNDSVESSAVTLAAPILLAFNAVNNLFGVGGSSMMSRALGRKDYETVKKSCAFGFYCALLSGVLFSLVYGVFDSQFLSLLGADSVTSASTGEYLFYTVTLGAVPSILNVVLSYMIRAEGASLHAGIGTMSGCILNIILDPIFILPWGLGMGSAGAGLATLIANCVSCLYFLVLIAVRKGRTFVTVSPADFSPSRDIVLGVTAVGVPAAIQNLLNVVGMTVLNNFTAASGDVDAITAMGIAHKINMIPMYVAMGIGQGTMPLISYNFASGNIERMKKSLVFTVKLSVSFLCVIAVLYYSFAGGLIGLFMKNESVIAFGERFLRGMSLAQPFLAMDFIAVGVFQACGMGKKSLVFAILRKVVFEIPALFILNAIFPLYGLAYAQFIAEFILAVSSVMVLARMFRRLEANKAA